MIRKFISLFIVCSYMVACIEHVYAHIDASSTLLESEGDITLRDLLLHQHLRTYDGEVATTVSQQQSVGSHLEAGKNLTFKSGGQISGTNVHGSAGDTLLFKAKGVTMKAGENLTTVNTHQSSTKKSMGGLKETTVTKDEMVQIGSFSPSLFHAGNKVVFDVEGTTTLMGTHVSGQTIEDYSQNLNVLAQVMGLSHASKTTTETTLGGVLPLSKGKTTTTGFDEIMMGSSLNAVNIFIKRGKGDGSSTLVLQGSSMNGETIETLKDLEMRKLELTHEEHTTSSFKGLNIPGLNQAFKDPTLQMLQGLKGMRSETDMERMWHGMSAFNTGYGAYKDGKEIYNWSQMKPGQSGEGAPSLLGVLASRYGSFGMTKTSSSSDTVRTQEVGSSITARNAIFINNLKTHLCGKVEAPLIEIETEELSSEGLKETVDYQAESKTQSLTFNLGSILKAPNNPLSYAPTFSQGTTSSESHTTHVSKTEVKGDVIKIKVKKTSDIKDTLFEAYKAGSFVCDGDARIENSADEDYQRACFENLSLSMSSVFGKTCPMMDFAKGDKGHHRRGVPEHRRDTFKGFGEVEIGGNLHTASSNMPSHTKVGGTWTKEELPVIDEEWDNSFSFQGTALMGFANNVGELAKALGATTPEEVEELTQELEEVQDLVNDTEEKLHKAEEKAQEKIERLQKVKKAVSESKGSKEPATEKDSLYLEGVLGYTVQGSEMDQILSDLAKEKSAIVGEATSKVSKGSWSDKAKVFAQSAKEVLVAYGKEIVTNPFGVAKAVAYEGADILMPGGIDNGHAFIKGEKSFTEALGQQAANITAELATGYVVGKGLKALGKVVKGAGHLFGQVMKKTEGKVGRGADNVATYNPLKKDLARQQQMGELKNVTLDSEMKKYRMAGPGTDKIVRDEPRLLTQYGGQPGDWGKIKSSNFTFGIEPSHELHAYKNFKTGQIVDIKDKIQAKTYKGPTS